MTCKNQQLENKQYENRKTENPQLPTGKTLWKESQHFFH